MGTKFVNVIKDQTIHSIEGHERFGNAIHTKLINYLKQQQTFT
jgi:hypothetical protein